MNKLFFLLIIVVAGFLQATLLKGFRVFNVSPDLLLAAMVIASLSFRPAWAIGLSIFAGFFKDLFCTGSFNTIFFAISSLVIIELRKKISLDNEFLRSALVLLVALSSNIAERLVNSYFGTSVSAWVSIKIIILDSLYTAIVSLFIFRAIRPRSSENL